LVRLQPVPFSYHSFFIYQKNDFLIIWIKTRIFFKKELIMFVIYDRDSQRVPIKVWLKDIQDIEKSCLDQAISVSNHPAIYHHLALMPDTHAGYALPIGGVAALDGVISPYYVGVDIGCGMGAVCTSLLFEDLDKNDIKNILNSIKKMVPVGNSHHSNSSSDHYERVNWVKNFIKDKIDLCLKVFNIETEGDLIEYMAKNLGTLGGNNHFIEIQKSSKGRIWLMIHSGSRNIGYRVANYYHKLAVEMNKKWFSNVANDLMAFLPSDSVEGMEYISMMNFSLNYAKENRRRIMNNFKTAVYDIVRNTSFLNEINIHHNFAALENHYGKNVWVHRKGATSAKKGELGIIPGSMGTSSYIVEGLGNSESFMSCSHGAGRKMGRMDASRTLTKEESEKAMTDIVFDGFDKLKDRKGNDTGLYDLGESPLAYKEIDCVIQNESDLVRPVVKLFPIGVVKG
jgi:tRNA-splicing ligase RtcB (3'-phosphate/5'-hydroxy nucleic acid ligase)